MIGGLLVTLDTSSPPACTHLELSPPASSEVIAATPPTATGALVETSAVFVSLPAGASLPFDVGDAICGSSRGFSLGYDPGTDGVVARPNGEVLLARADAMPYPPEVIAGWRFDQGAETARVKRDEDYWHSEHRTLASHGGQTVSIPYGGSVELHALEGVYDVAASSYSTEGPLPTWMRWLSKRGYGVSILLQRYEVLPPLQQADVCSGDRAVVDSVLRGYPKDVENPQSGPVTIGDLPRATPMHEGTFGDPTAGAGYWGSTDFDGDGVEDRIVEYTGIDFWSRLFFPRRGGCFSFVGVVEGYQVELVPPLARARGVRVLPYPIGPAARIEGFRWTGTAFVKKSGGGTPR